MVLHQTLFLFSLLLAISHSSPLRSSSQYHIQHNEDYELSLSRHSREALSRRNFRSQNKEILAEQQRLGTVLGPNPERGIFSETRPVQHTQGLVLQRRSAERKVHHRTMGARKRNHDSPTNKLGFFYHPGKKGKRKG